MSSSIYNLFEGAWPVLEQTSTPYTDQVFKDIQISNNGGVISTNLGHLTLGLFYIHSSLLEPHGTQRPLESSHVDRLVKDFNERGIFKAEHPGVVIGLGEGWNHMKHQKALPYMISPTSPHLSNLSLTSNGPIGQVIRGDHRTAAIKKYAEERNEPEESYWLYRVLVPGIFFILFEV
jgi:hypothetical protein